MALVGYGFLAGCAAILMNPSAEKIRVVTTELAGCEYLGEVPGDQSGSFEQTNVTCVGVAYKR